MNYALETEQQAVRGIAQVPWIIRDSQQLMTSSKKTKWVTVYRVAKSRLSIFGILWMAFMTFIAILAPHLAPNGYADYSMYVYAPPSWQHWLGTDNSGRDLFSLLIYAIRYAMQIAAFATVIAFLIGVSIGLTAGLSNSVVDQILMRITDAMFVFPSFYMAMILVVGVGHSILAIGLSIGLVMWAGFARLARTLTLSVRNTELMESGRAAGASPFYLARVYVFPIILNSIIVYTAFTMAAAMLQEAYIDYLGLGLPNPKPSFGLLLFQGVRNLDGYPWQFWPPTIVFIGTLVSLVFIGDGLQTALNPKRGGFAR